MRFNIKVVSVVLMALLASTVSFACKEADPLLLSVEGKARTADNKARDNYRNPAETLEFFEVTPEQTVVEIWPGGGWYTEILAPYLKSGTFYAAHFPAESAIPYFQKNRAKFDQKLAADPASYGGVVTVEFVPGENRLQVPEGTADRVLTFRNVHNWLRNGAEQAAFELFYKALKPGGKLGVVEHRSKVAMDRETMLKSGYMTEASVIQLAEQAGFVLEVKSEVNANPKDTADHPSGVWTLPPRLRADDDKKAHYQAIGESDRMTLLFRKPLAK